MKNLQSTTEGTWIELKQVELTEDQKALLKSKNKEVKKTLMEEIKALREVNATVKDTKSAKSKYNSIKPSLESDDVYELISADMVSIDNNLSGILNFRLNGKHKQIRF
ncbi:hypothetical protein [Lutibacter sp.]|uniref:hypothetical protein n=1 Tax=Lutibacter sp. TaxID=1925666 RepID=UPI0034A02BC4